MHPDFAEFCAASQMRNPASIWTFYSDMIRVRKQHRALVYGAYQLVDPHHESVHAFTRTEGRETYLAVLNFTEDRVEWDVPAEHRGVWSVVISNFGRATAGQELGAKIELGPFDGIIWRREFV
ncbi:hypothetical protein GE09DRAFT_1289885 [Coniochaeta sp. 2T2.1]|nr:hypothetical protein GE09DRAFT_1289885 [Coniochaeta sp. 2T2.1]